MVVLVACVLLCAAHEALAFYNPQTGRWLSRDPIGEMGGINLCEAFSNNPLSYSDRNGLDIFSFPPGGVNSVPKISIPLFEFENPSTGDNSSAYCFGVSWLTGTSASERDFSGQDTIARQMRATPEAEKARAELKSNLKSGCKIGMRAPMSRHLGSEGPDKFYEGFILDLAGRNPARAFMGSFDGNAIVTRCCCICAVVRFTLVNVAGWQSATRFPPPYGYDPDRQSFVENPSFDTMPRSILPDNYFGDFGRNVKITVSWIEAICP